MANIYGYGVMIIFRPPNSDATFLVVSPNYRPDKQPELNTMHPNDNPFYVGYIVNKNFWKGNSFCDYLQENGLYCLPESGYAREMNDRIMAACCT